MRPRAAALPVGRFLESPFPLPKGRSEIGPYLNAIPFPVSSFYFPRFYFPDVFFSDFFFSDFPVSSFLTFPTCGHR